MVYNEGPSCLRHCSAPQATPMLFQSPFKSIFVEGDTVTFWCFQGYKLKGYSKITCISNGQWNGSVPSCELLSTGLCEWMHRYNDIHFQGKESFSLICKLHRMMIFISS